MRRTLRTVRNLGKVGSLVFDSADVLEDVAAGGVGFDEFQPVFVGFFLFFGIDEFTDVSTA